nr:peptidoglycan-binding protein [Pedobacter sp. ASV19]
MFFCFIAFGGSGLHGGDLLGIASREVGVRELSGRNDGPRVEEYLSCVGLKRGAPYCAAFVSWVFMEAGYGAPRTGWSPALFPARRIVKDAAPGMVFGIYFKSLGRIGHCGLVQGVKGDWVVTVEANTDPSGGRNGDGVYLRMRHKRSIYRYANWLCYGTGG